MTTIDVGLLGLDTSHGEAFADVLAETDGATVAAIWDGGTVRDAAYVEEFCEEHDATAYDDPAGVREVVDAAMVLSVDWERHCSLATPFLDAGIPTLVDKPVASRLGDVQALADAASDTPVFGGSAIPFHPGFADLPVNESHRHLYAVGYGDPFYYGVHLADTARSLAGTDWTGVEPSGESGEVVVVDFENDTHATLRLDGPSDGATFGIVDAADRVRTARAPSDQTAYTEMYRRFTEAFLETVRGERAAKTRVLDGATLVLAIHAALTTDQRVTPKSEALATVDVGSDEFVADYRPYY